jgi:hypothetical protein
MQAENLFCQIPTEVCERVDAEYRSQHQTLLPAELLTFLLSATSAEPIKYSGTVEGPDGLPIKRRWTVSWSDKYGSPTQSTIRTFIALYRIWKDTKFESRDIKFDTTTIIDLSGGNTLEQIKADLHLLFGVSISYNYGGFGLFDSVTIGRTGGCVFASRALHYTVLNEEILLDEWVAKSE